MTVNDTTTRIAMRLERDRLLNTWLREFRPDLFDTIQIGQEVRIAAGEVAIIFKCHRFSPGGFHRFDAHVTVKDQSGSRVIDEVHDLADLLLQTQPDAASEKHEDILRRVSGSSAASREHATFLARARPGVNAVTLEQSLWFGHPFHPLAKSVAGFTDTDTEKYSPERAARFQLRWLLVNRRYIAEFESDQQRPDAMDLRLLSASGLSMNDVKDEVLFPCHPWQAARLETNPDLADLLRSREIRITDAMGDLAIPTSSVRTVWFPDHKIFVKLPIETRITNFPRVNTDEQIARSVAGAQAIAVAAPAVERAGLTVLDEPIGRIVRTRNADGSVRHHPETGYLLRSADFGRDLPPLVIAGLLETDPATGAPNLAVISGHHLQSRESTHRWLEAYMRVSLIPLLRLFDETGIVLEAHSQNSLVRFVDGWPDRLFVRDLEGIAVDRNVFERRFDRALAMHLDQALFYDRATVWRRLLYYVIVNHFSHVVATTAFVSDVDESDLWSKAKLILEQVSGIAAVGELLGANALPAKANLKSCLDGNSESPSYVLIPNPFQAGRPAASYGIHQSNLAEVTP